MKASKVITIFLTATVIFAATSCKVRTPKGIISPDKMENLLYDYHEAQAIAKNTNNKDNNTEIYTEAVLQKYNVSRKEFNNSMEYYSRHADQLYKIYTNLEKRFQNEIQANGGALENDINYSNLTANGDTANIWTFKTYGLLLPQPGKNRFEFHINADTSFKPKDRYEWHFTTMFVYKEGRKNAQAVISIKYANDSVSCAQQPIYGEGDNVLTIDASNLPIKQIEGFVYLDEPKSDAVKLLFISKVSMIRFHTKETVETTKSSVADSTANSQEAAKKSFIDSIQQSVNKKDEGDHFRATTRKRALPHQKE